MSLSKKELRQKFTLVRQNDVGSFLADSKITENIIDSGFLAKADSVFCYYSVGTEVDTIKLIEYLLQKGIKTALPYCIDKEGLMEFYFIESTDDLVIGMFSIMEPDTEKCLKASYTEKTLCIVPALAFDKDGYRLGYGKGYYDRFLSDFCGTSLGLCRENCLCKELPAEKLDQKVDYIVTENKLISTNIKEEY